MSINVGDIVITSIDTINVFDAVTGAYRFTLDELQNVSISQSEETTDITGKQGRRLSRLKKNKTCTISATNGIVSNGLLELQTGGEFQSGTQTIMRTEYLGVKVVDGAATVTMGHNAYGTAGAEIVSLFVKDNNGVAKKLTQTASTPATGEFTYTAGEGTGASATSPTITFFAGDVQDGQEAVVIYKQQVTADYLKNHSDIDNKKNKAALYIDVLGENKCGKIYHLQFYFPKVDISGDFSFEMGDNQTVHSFEAEALVGACGASSTFWTYTIFGEEDAA